MYVVVIVAGDGKVKKKTFCCKQFQWVSFNFLMGMGIVDDNDREVFFVVVGFKGWFFIHNIKRIAIHCLGINLLITVFNTFSNIK